MDEDTSKQDYIAPLQLRRAQRVEAEDETIEDAVVDEYHQPRPKFQNFLRASYPFQPTATPSPSTVTLTLNAGDIILVHSVHTNGWADGTLLETGARGWLPTNYCESYDYGTMRPLLKALTEFWDIIRSGDELDAALFHNHDYMRGVVAGVRFLLEKSDCLTRESRWVKQYDTVRRIRKALLADLSNLVKAAKFLQQLAVTEANIDEVADLLDDMLLRAFKVVTRAVSFFDIWSEEIASRDPSVLPSQQATSERPGSIQDAQSIESHEIHSPYNTRQPSLISIAEDKNPRKRPSSVSSRRQVLSHRMSYTGRRSRTLLGNLASEQLNSTYDAFLGVLASFLGSHMQSRSSSELLLTTQLAVKACRKLLAVVERIIEHEPDQAHALRETKDNMCDKIAELVDAAKQVFRPLQSQDDDVIYLPSEGIQLVNAATACVSGAGRCVSRARLILEDIGDFEIDFTRSSLPSPTETRNPVNAEVNESHTSNNDGANDNSTTKPQLVVSTLEIPQAVMELDTAVSETNPFWTPAEAAIERPNPSPTSVTSQPLPNVPPHSTVHRPYLRDVIHSTGSETTLISSVRDSGPSFISDGSTRAASPDRTMKQSPLSPNIDNFTPPENEDSDGEQEIMEQTFAHELLVNNEGRIIGGTLNAVIERVSAHDFTPDNVLLSTIYLTFRLFTTPIDFAKALAYRFEYVGRTPRIAGPVRLRVYNLLKGWLEDHWRHDCDAPALPFVREFSETIMMSTVPTAGRRILDLVHAIVERQTLSIPRVQSSLGKNSISNSINSDQGFPAPIITKTQLNSLRTWRSGGALVNIVDFDPLEIARQITIKESNLFCEILPEELLSTEFTKQSSSLSLNVRAMAQLSTDLANLVADSILQLEEAKKRAAIVKHWIKIAKKCLELNNYDTLMAIVCSINSSTILRLKRTWDLINQKTKSAFEELKKVVDVSKNYSSLRQRVAAHVPPCLPFVGMYLTDLTFVDHGNSSTRQLKTGNEEISVINLDKHMKTTKIISDLQRFQIPYRLTEVPELQNWLQDELVRVRAAGERNFQNHYRRSLVLEPREAAPRPTTLSSMAAITGSKEKFDFLAWTQFGRDKTASVTL